MGRLQQQRRATVLVYAAMALICWLVPTRLPDGQGAEIVNVYPMRLLGFVSALLACIDWILSLPGRVSVATAVCWAVGTLSLALSVTVLLAGPTRAGAVQSLVLNIQRIGLTMSGLLLFVLVTQVFRNTVTLRLRAVVRGAIIGGLLLLVGIYGWAVLRLLGLLAPSGTGLEAAASDASTFSLGLLFSGAALGLGIVMHGVLSRPIANSREQPGT